MQFAHIPISANLVSRKQALDLFHIYPKIYAILLFTRLMDEYDQRHSNRDIRKKQKSLLIHGNTRVASSH
jgi:hypothetical protein